LNRFTPGSSPYALTVGGTQQNDNLYLRLFDGTNYGKCVDIFAPGQDIMSAGIRSNDAVDTYSGTSQATPLVSGAAAIYWNIKINATPVEIKNIITSTCTRNKLKIKTAIPSSFADQSPNCLLHLENKATSIRAGSDIINPPYHVFHSVSSSELKMYIKDMTNNSYALTYIHSHQINSSVHYSLIFRYMADVEFLTIVTSKRKQMKSEISDHQPNGYHLTLLYSSSDATDHIAVLEKTNLTYSHDFRLTQKSHDKMYHSKSSQNDSLLSTTVIITAKGESKYSSVYVHNNLTTHHLSNVSVPELMEALNVQLSQKFYLTHLSTIPTDPPSCSVVFQKMTKPFENYILSKDLELDEVEEFVQMQVSKGLTPLVVAGIDTPSGLKFIVSLKH